MPAAPLATNSQLHGTRDDAHHVSRRPPSAGARSGQTLPPGGPLPSSKKTPLATVEASGGVYRPPAPAEPKKEEKKGFFARLFGGGKKADKEKKKQPKNGALGF